MSDKQNPTVAALRAAFASKEVWNKLTEDQQDIIKQTAADIEAMAETLQQQESALEGTPLPEAHSSANVYMVDPATKANVRFTFRGHTDTDVERRVVEFLARTTGKATSLYWLTQDAYRDEAWGNRGGEKQATKPQPTPAQQANGSDGNVMTCPAQKLAAMQKSANDSALMWKVWTPKSKYAVPVYLEDDELAGTRERLVSAGIDIQNFMKDGKLAEYDLTGWTAHYLPTEKDGEVKPWPSKIVDLTK